MTIERSLWEWKYFYVWYLFSKISLKWTLPYYGTNLNTFLNYIPIIYTSFLIFLLTREKLSHKSRFETISKKILTNIYLFLQPWKTYTSLTPLTKRIISWNIHPTLLILQRAEMAGWMCVIHKMPSSSYICVFFSEYLYDSKIMSQNSVERRAKVWKFECFCSLIYRMKPFTFVEATRLPR